MTKPRLHMDADTSNEDLVRELLKRGHDVTRTPNEWATLTLDDKLQIQGATERGRIIFTFNKRDFMPIAKSGIHHAGILLSPQRPMARLFKALDRFLTETTAEEMENQVRWLSDWEK
ncbi:MAG: DUF5615 family PIN-like protein [Chloroflexota bacterium]